MWWKRISIGFIIAALGVGMAASLAAASETFDDGEYTLVLPGAGTFVFEIASEETIASEATINPVGDRVIVGSWPDGYVVDDDDPDKAAWKHAATVSLEIEAKSDKVEGAYDWEKGPAMLTLPGGGSITVMYYEAGSFSVAAEGGDWTAFGSGSDWFVANNGDIELATEFFKVEADENGIEIKRIDGRPDDGFLNDVDDEEEAEVEEVELEEEDEGEGGGESRGLGRNKAGSGS